MTRDLAAAFRVIVGTPEIVVIEGSERAVERKYRQAVSRQLQLAEPFGSLGVGLSSAVALTVPCQVLAGAGNGATNVADTTLIHRHVPRGAQARAFGLMGTAAFVGGSVASVAGGLLLDATSARTVFVVAGAGTLAVAALVVVLVPRETLRRGPGSDGPPRGP